MKIALVVHDLHDHGGHSLYTKILADELSRRHSVTVFANRCERPINARWSSHYVRAWRGSALACVQTFPLGLRSQSAALDSFDIRHTQGYCGGKPNIVTAHICVAAYLESLRSVSLRHRLSLRLQAAAEARFYRHYEGQVIAISDKVASELREFYKVRGPINVISHGVDVKRFKSVNREAARKGVRHKLGIQEDQTMALYVGDLTKAHAYLKELAEAAPDVQFGIVTYSRAYRWNRSNVHILPPTSHLERYYAAADAFVFPTTYDAFGMVLLEAMASGLAVFSSDCAGAAELIDSGRDGFVTPLDEWVEATAVGLRDRALLRRVGNRAEQTAYQHDWLSVVKAVEQLYLGITAA
ncbi:MAG TPA: glycosyltransferase family 4 protein [Pyrinomonadaceae bacterium]|nr:glycosyltransferase family 4 protein [Pyrinomonadaceae bacterium]